MVRMVLPRTGKSVSVEKTRQKFYEAAGYVVKHIPLEQAENGQEKSEQTEKLEQDQNEQKLEQETPKKAKTGK